MSNKLDAGYVKANSSNLPTITALTVFNFFSCDERFTLSECRSTKSSRSANEVYGDIAVGYVQLQIPSNTHKCLILARVCPEHRVTSKSYRVCVEINERECEIVNGQCLDCAASQGGCKHLIVFVMWLHRRSEEPSPTDIKCYWEKSLLSRVGSSIKYKEAKDFIQKK